MAARGGGLNMAKKSCRTLHLSRRPAVLRLEARPRPASQQPKEMKMRKLLASTALVLMAASPLAAQQATDTPLPCHRLGGLRRRAVPALDA